MHLLVFSFTLGKFIFQNAKKKEGYNCLICVVLLTSWIHAWLTVFCAILTYALPFVLTPDDACFLLHLKLFHPDLGSMGVWRHHVTACSHMSSLGDALECAANGKDCSSLNAWCEHRLWTAIGGSYGKYPTPQKVHILIMKVVPTHLVMCMMWCKLAFRDRSLKPCW
jgi:hypothetical protein